MIWVKIVPKIRNNGRPHITKSCVKWLFRYTKKHDHYHTNNWKLYHKLYVAMDTTFRYFYIFHLKCFSPSGFKYFSFLKIPISYNFTISSQQLIKICITACKEQCCKTNFAELNNLEWLKRLFFLIFNWTQRKM